MFCFIISDYITISFLMTSSKVFSWEVCLPLSRTAPYYPHTAILSKMLRSCSVLLALVRGCNFLRVMNFLVLGIFS